jgi:hypothetical protein
VELVQVMNLCDLKFKSSILIMKSLEFLPWRVELMKVTSVDGRPDG